MNTRTIIIAEVKPKSPTFESGKTWEELFMLADSVGDWLSIHTHEWFGGSMERISQARSIAPNKPILAKGFHFTDEEVDEALARGATYVLTVGRIPRKNEERCIVEPYFLEDFLQLPTGFKIVWNSRDIYALLNKTEPRVKEGFDEVRKIRPGAWICQASHLRTVSDVHPEADAVLVGTDLASFAASLHRG